jgi:hypothetical protein
VRTLTKTLPEQVSDALKVFTAYQQVKRKDLQAVVDGYCKFWV